MMRSFALFRLPYEKRCTLVVQTTGVPQELMACNELSGQQGFVMAPFAVSSKHPLLLIRADEVTSDLTDLDGLSDLVDTHGLTALDKGVHADYHMNFANFHAQLCNHSFQKLVLSRSIELPRTGDETPLQLFQRACERYPRMMICLVYTPQSGLWLAATPEILLAGKDHRWQTIALAGTMKYEEELRWSDKNIQEQRYVATYITRQLEQFTHDFTEEAAQRFPVLTARRVRGGRFATGASSYPCGLWTPQAGGFPLYPAERAARPFLL